MNETTSISIPFSKDKTLLWLLGAIVFVALGSWLLFDHPIFNNALLDNPWVTKTVGIITLLFFGISVYFFLLNLMAKGPGMVIDENGIKDFSSAASVDKIYWKDIESIEMLTIKSQPLILFKVRNPQTYIDQQTSRFKRKMLEINYKWYGAPIGISANGLRISFEELWQIVSVSFEMYKCK